MVPQLPPDVMRSIYGRSDKRTQARMRAVTRNVHGLPAPTRPQTPWKTAVRRSEKRILQTTAKGPMAGRLAYAAMDIEHLLAVPGKNPRLTDYIVHNLAWREVVGRGPPPGTARHALAVYLAAVDGLAAQHGVEHGVTPADRSRRAQSVRTRRKRLAGHMITVRAARRLRQQQG